MGGIVIVLPSLRLSGLGILLAQMRVMVVRSNLEAIWESVSLGTTMYSRMVGARGLISTEASLRVTSFSSITGIAWAAGASWGAGANGRADFIR